MLLSVPSCLNTIQLLRFLSFLVVKLVDSHSLLQVERLESGLYSRSYLENQMVVALGGRCGLYGKSVSFRNPLIAAVDGPWPELLPLF
jgi:hypothetical protein